jgi:tetratricopeptide (TPR) repeat protein
MFDRDDMKAYAEKFFANRLMTWFLMSNQVFQSYISGLVSFRLYRETRDPSWAEKGAKAKAKLQLWATHGSMWNFEHRFLLLQAEEFYCNYSLNNAAVTYDKAVSSASAHKFINDEALAHELAGKFYFETGNLQKSLEHFTLAHEKYQQWGAYAKADMLFARIQEKFTSALHIDGRLTNLSFSG